MVFTAGHAPEGIVLSHMLLGGGEIVLDILPRRDMPVVISKQTGESLPVFTRHIQMFRQSSHTGNQVLTTLHIGNYPGTPLLTARG